VNLYVVTHPTGGFAGIQTIKGFSMSFVAGTYTGPVPTSVVAELQRIGYTVVAAPAKDYTDAFDASVATLVSEGAPQTAAALRAAYGLVVKVTDPAYGAKGNGTSDDTAALQAAVNAAAAASGEVFLPRGTYKVSAPITLAAGVGIRGSGTSVTQINATHAGAVFATATPGARTYFWRFENLRIAGPGSTTAGSVGIDLDSVSSAAMTNVEVAGFEKAIRIRSSINGGATYNRLTNVTASGCATGFSVEATGSNSTVFTNCRANACTSYGVRITDSNATIWIGGQIESCAVGFSVAATSSSLSDMTRLAFTRFESNTTAWEITSANVRYAQISYVQPFGAYSYTDSGTGTQLIGGDGLAANVARSLRQDTAGSWLFQRDNDGGAGTPTMLVRDTATSTGIPITYQAETERYTGFFFRGNRGGATYFDVSAFEGSIRMPQGGNVEFTKRSSDADQPPANTARLYLKDNGSGKAQLCVRFETGAVQVIATQP
jgi:hypothetical protein